MKTAYEIAWDLIGTHKVNLRSSEIATMTGLSRSNIDDLALKKDIVRRLPEKKHLDLVKQVIEEIEQGKPHWELKTEAGETQ
ncbi:hypothetical protein Cva_01645 [Caedimonas varicaedens]|uniref:Uncharacterized protein n=1 Tax=Caedimonas varicaedens TaxID=1629334 RepID=A0A0K8MEN9_9PROT|nr:hypothetical protein Cva_01645 [Caedimonas varicaedens]